MKKRLLLIDDEKDITELTGCLFRFHDFEVDAINESSQLEAILAQKQFDLIVTDLMMPQISGFEIIAKIRARPNYSQTPIIALSAKNLSDQERKLLLQNKIHWMAKPFEPLALVEKIKRLLGE